MMSTYVVIDPHTGVIASEHAAMSGDEIEQLLEDASRAGSSWPRCTRVSERAAVLASVAVSLRDDASRLAGILVTEMGKPIGQALDEVELTAAIFDYYGQHAERFLADEPLAAGDVRAFVRKAPLGPILGIMPWNFPLYQSARFAAPNLALGNPVVLKPAPQCPDSARALQEIIESAGSPAGAFTVALIDTPDIAGVIADARIRGVSLTGSERAGRAVAEVAGRNLKPLVLELGGADPFLVLGGDLVRAARDAALSRVFNAGQTCTAAKRMIVLDAHYDEFVDEFVAQMATITPDDPREPATRLGPLASAAAARLLRGQIDDALASGARALLINDDDGAGTMFAPVVLADVDDANPAAREEFFGPVA